MKHVSKTLLVGSLAIAVCLGFSLSAMAADPTFIGSSKCKMCHSKVKMGGAEYLKWQKGSHSKAFKTLATDAAKEMGAKIGVTDPATDEKCLKCHITDASIADNEKIRAEGVGCERCHGAGSAYKSKTVMSDYDKAIAAGMRKLKGENEEKTKKNIEALCRECHGLEHKDINPGAKEFKFKEQLAKMKHDEETLKKEFPDAFK
jgi:hypothetical protein